MLQEVATRKSSEVVDVEDLGQRAREQLDMADEVGEEYRRIGEEKSAKHQIKAGEYLLRALPYISNETKKAYCERVTRRAYSTCKDHMNAAEKWQTRRLANSDAAATKYPNSIRGFSRPSDAGKDRRHREWTGPVDDMAARARKEQAKEAATVEQERRRKQELAKRLISIGYKVLAKELHPDAGGSRDAMARLTEVKNRLLGVYGG